MSSEPQEVLPLSVQASEKPPSRLLLWVVAAFALLVPILLVAAKLHRGQAMSDVIDAFLVAATLSATVLAALLTLRPFGPPVPSQVTAPAVASAPCVVVVGGDIDHVNVRVDGPVVEVEVSKLRKTCKDGRPAPRLISAEGSAERV